MAPLHPLPLLSVVAAVFLRPSPASSTSSTIPLVHARRPSLGSEGSSGFKEEECATTLSKRIRDKRGEMFGRQPHETEATFLLSPSFERRTMAVAARGGDVTDVKKKSIHRVVALGGVVAVVVAVQGRGHGAARAREAAVAQLVNAFSGAFRETIMMVFSMALALVEM